METSNTEQDHAHATTKSETSATATAYSQIWVKPKLTVNASTQGQTNSNLHRPLTFEEAMKRSEEQRCHIIPEADPATASPNPGDVFITQQPILLSPSARAIATYRN